MVFMKLVGIDIGKHKHFVSIVDKLTGEIILQPVAFSNNAQGFEFLISQIALYPVDSVLIGMEDTGHYHFALLRFLLQKNYNVALINPKTTDLNRRMDGGITKNDKLDTLNICDILSSNKLKKPYRLTSSKKFDLYEQKQLTRLHHSLKEQINVLSNRLQKCIDLVFPEYNALFKSKYGKVYMSILKQFGSAKAIAQTDIRTLRKCFDITGRGNRISLTAEKLKESAKTSVGISSLADEMQIKHLIAHIELLNDQLKEIDKKIEEFSTDLNSPIISVPGISHFSGTSILAEYGDIFNYSKPSKIIKAAGVAPFHYESSQYEAKHSAITKQGSSYLRKTLYQVIVPVIRFNKVFKDYYDLKRSQGKSHRCAQGHCIRKLLRVIYHLVTTNQQFDASLLR